MILCRDCLFTMTSTRLTQCDKCAKTADCVCIDDFIGDDKMDSYVSFIHSLSDFLSPDEFVGFCKGLIFFCASEIDPRPKTDEKILFLLHTMRPKQVKRGDYFETPGE